jgi:hypothetical protein
MSCYGYTDVRRGSIRGDRLLFESIGDASNRLRLIWDASDPNEILWRNEMSLNGGPSTLVEEYRCTPIAAAS